MFLAEGEEDISLALSSLEADIDFLGHTSLGFLPEKAPGSSLGRMGRRLP